MFQVRFGSSCAVIISLLAQCLLTNSGNADELRTWTDAAGRKTEAKFVRIFNGEVILEKDGRALKVPLARFSPADQQYIRGLTGGNASPAAAPSGSDDKQPAPSSGDAAKPNSANGNDAASPAGDAQAKAAAAELRLTRAWRDTAGNTMQGRFERFFGNRVVLMRGNRPVTIDYPRLSAADQEFLRRNFTAQGRAAEVPQIASAASGASAAPAGERAGAAASIAASPAGGSTGPASVTGPGMPDFGDFASRMRQQQEQTRATHEQIRAQIEQMRDQMRAAREASSRPAMPTPLPEHNPAGAAPPPIHTAASPPQVATSSSSFTPTHSAFDARRQSNAFPSSATVNPADPAIDRPASHDHQPSPVGAQPPDPFALAPSTQPQYQAVVVCGACNAQQKPGFKAGDRCQSCGTVIDEIEDESGKVVERSSRSTRRNVKFWVWAAIVVIGLIGSAITKLRGGS